MHGWNATKRVQLNDNCVAASFRKRLHKENNK